MEELIQKKGEMDTAEGLFLFVCMGEGLTSSQPGSAVGVGKPRWFEWLSINHLSKLPQTERILGSVSQGLMLILAFLFQSGLSMDEEKASEEGKLLQPA